MISKEVVRKWDEIPEIDYPAADISFSYTYRGVADVTVHFSHLKGLPNRDLVITFKGVVAIRHAIESYGFNNIKLPRPLPKCLWHDRNYAFPLLKVDDSSWLKDHENCGLLENSTVHFAILTLNDEIEILADPDPMLRWIPGLDGTIVNPPV